MEHADGLAAHPAVPGGSSSLGWGTAMPCGRHAAPHAGPAPPSHAGLLPGPLPRLRVPPRSGHLHRPWE
eukprot:11734259-Alexandrium_andersonii.AAC.1